MTIRTATIANGTSLSGIIAIGDDEKGVVAVQLPATWTAANLTFQASFDGVAFADVTDKAGTEYTLTAVVNKMIIVPVADLGMFKFLKIRSGTAGVPVNQAAARDLLVATQDA